MAVFITHANFLFALTNLDELGITNEGLLLITNHLQTAFLYMMVLP